MYYGVCPWLWRIGELVLAYNFISPPKTQIMVFYVIIFFIWSAIVLNSVLIHRYHILLNSPNIVEHRIQETNTPSISLERLNRFLKQFSTWVPSSLRIHKIDINPAFIKVYGRVDDEKKFSRLWEHFKTQDWAHQLRLLKWELHSASRWIFAFQVNM
jgi:hypothetical protein